MNRHPASCYMEMQQKCKIILNHLNKYSYAPYSANADRKCSGYYCLDNNYYDSFDNNFFNVMCLEF